VGGRLAPDANEEYRLYQTLLACWPVEEEFVPDEAFRERIRDHVRKAVNEAHRNTHWLVQNEPWMQALDAFVNALLSPATGGEFLARFTPRAQRLAHLGLVNSLVQLVLKVTTPGVPDFYQGCEQWNFSLVDPDNRRLVEWAGRAELAAAARATPWRELLRHWRTAGIKVRLTEELLRHRREHLALYQQGDYEPLEAKGRLAKRLVGFRRRRDAESIVVLVPRLTARLGCPPLGLVWENTTVELPPAPTGWRDVLTGREWPTGGVAVAELLVELPFVLLAPR
jgi:(1->4)-alpha-D-glucan 1-alpha-D-glucosylmutase